MLRTIIDPKIKITKPEELLNTLPRVITVNKFCEESVTKFNRELNEAKISGQPVIPIVIDSYGGEVYSLLAMIDALKDVNVPVATVVLGKAMSCGAILFSQGTEGYRFMGPNATLMIHDVSTGSFGKTEEIKADAKEASRLNRLIYRLMAKNTGHRDTRYFWKIVHDKGRADWFLTPEEALKHNLANKIHIPSMNVRVNYTVDFS